MELDTTAHNFASARRYRVHKGLINRKNTICLTEIELKKEHTDIISPVFTPYHLNLQVDEHSFKYEVLTLVKDLRINNNVLGRESEMEFLDGSFSKKMVKVSQ